MQKLIITVAPTGSVPRKKHTTFIPVTPDEIADAAYASEQEGASIIHVHCRDENENPTSNYDIFKETVEKIRKRTRLIIMTSTSGVAGHSDEDRAQPLRLCPEMASLTTGSLNFVGRKPPEVYVNSWETMSFLAKRMIESDIKPEIEIFDVGFIGQGAKLIQQGLVKEPAHFQLVMGVDGGIPATPGNLQHLSSQLTSNATYSVTGIGRSQLSMITMAIILGGHVRVGLEDNIYYAKGKLAPNEDFVSRVRQLAETLQREIATPDDARQILGLRARQ